MTVSNIEQNNNIMAITGYLNSARLSAQEYYDGVQTLQRLMSVQKHRNFNPSELLMTVAEVTNLPSTYKVSHVTHGEVYYTQYNFNLQIVF